MKAIIRPLSLLPNVLVGLLSFLLAVPLFILAYHRIPDFDWPYHSDKILIFFLIAVSLFLMVRSFKFIIITAVIAAVGWLWYGTLAGKYGFKERHEEFRRKGICFYRHPLTFYGS
ncbi:MAG: hypothetical protein E6H10_16795 [Bacteroidetes bacterium]|nr:MAG: hypothetical protein E6H10_16795 [Bacteroidota bacterium]